MYILHTYIQCSVKTFILYMSIKHIDFDIQLSTSFGRIKSHGNKKFICLFLKQKNIHYTSYSNLVLYAQKLVLSPKSTLSNVHSIIQIDQNILKMFGFVDQIQFVTYPYFCIERKSLLYDQTLQYIFLPCKTIQKRNSDLRLTLQATLNSIETIEYTWSGPQVWKL